MYPGLLLAHQGYETACLAVYCYDLALIHHKRVTLHYLSERCVALLHKH
jgi:hypothetical protein